jgi:hypothetical protein
LLLQTTYIDDILIDILRVDYGPISDAFLQPFSPMELAVRPSTCSASGCLCAGQLGRRLDLVEAKVLPHSSNDDPRWGRKWHIFIGTLY